MQKETPGVIRGDLRKRVLLLLTNPNTPTALAKRLGTDRPSVSRAILFLCSKGLVRCLNPDDKRGRLYAVTAKGKKVIVDIKRMG
jgi:DNA-binding MarR family transcriptional regulator